MGTIKDIDIAEQELIDILGYEDLFNQLSAAMSYDTKEDLFAYIARNNEIELSVDIKEN